MSPEYPNIARMAKLDLSSANLGSLLLYCHKCPYQIIDAFHRPQCPDCGAPLYTTRADQELFDLCTGKITEQDCHNALAAKEESVQEKARAHQEATTKGTIFVMDEMEHEVGGNCCVLRKACKCGGRMHYQPVYGGFYYECEKCHTTES